MRIDGVRRDCVDVDGVTSGVTTSVRSKRGHTRSNDCPRPCKNDWFGQKTHPPSHPNFLHDAWVPKGPKAFINKPHLHLVVSSFFFRSREGHDSRHLSLGLKLRLTLSALGAACISPYVRCCGLIDATELLRKDCTPQNVWVGVIDGFRIFPAPTAPVECT